MSERRHAERLLSCIPAFVNSPEGDQELAVIRDVSVTGARLLTRVELEEGHAVSLDLYLSGDKEQALTAGGTVIRVEANPDNELWRWEVGVRFARPIIEYAEQIESFTRRQHAEGVL